MSAVRPVWFLPRTRDRPPESAITLGDIIASPWEPDEPINGNPAPQISSHNCHIRHEPSWSWSKEFFRSTGGGLFASFLNISGLGPEFHVNGDTARREVYTADVLITKSFIPDRMYLQQSLQDPDVQDALTAPRRKRRLYMISGIKVAHGATFAAHSLKQRGTYVQIGVDATSLGVPITVGPKSHFADTISEHQRASPSDFVFAYQLRELMLKDGVMKQRRYERGAFYRLGDISHHENADIYLDVDKVKVSDASVVELGLQHLELVDGSGEAIVCVLPDTSVRN